MDSQKDWQMDLMGVGEGTSHVCYGKILNFELCCYSGSVAFCRTVRYSARPYLFLLDAGDVRQSLLVLLYVHLTVLVWT